MHSVVLFSGGMDSATALTQAVQGHGAPEVLALYCRYPSKHGPMELHYARNFAHRLGVELVERDVSAALNGAKSSLLVGQDGPMVGAPTVVPGRNRAFLLEAFDVAQERSAIELVFAPHKGDAAIYQDCRREFVQEMQRAAARQKRGVYLRAPFLNKTKAEVAVIGQSLGVDFDCTWSCYAPTRLQEPCGECGACQERATVLALAAAGGRAEGEKG